MKIQQTVLDTDQKALKINLDPQIYGTFAEIGAGQEVARYFFKVGGAAGTIAKTMSAYDKTYSDEIYGVEESGRYVCESRIKKMLDHEYDLLTNRLEGIREDSTFFVFADSIAALNFNKTIKGEGWLGVRFQLKPNTPPNELILHVKMLDNSSGLQHSAIGILGVNMMYAIYEYHRDPKRMICSLLESLKNRVQIDMVKLSGPDFEVENRLLAYWLVKYQLSPVSMFNAKGNAVHASEFLYKKNIMVVRGSFRPVTLMTNDLIENAYEQFIKEPGLDGAHYLFIEIMPSDIENNEQDFLDRSALLNYLGYSIIVSNCKKHEMLVDYLEEYKFKRLGIAMGAKKLRSIISEKYDTYAESSLLEGFGKLFRNKVRLYVYPAMKSDQSELLTTKNIEVPAEMVLLYRHLLANERLVDIYGFKADVLHIFGKETLKKMQNNDVSWRMDVPNNVARYIKEHDLFKK